MTKGISDLANQTKKKWKGKQRPKGWVGNVFGLVVHTTGGGLPAKALKRNENPVDTAVNFYNTNHGTHYVIGWDGDLVQIATEDMVANGVGVTNKDPKINQILSVARGWENDLPKAMVDRWKKRWPKYKTPLQLFPTKYANSCYVHVECIPCIFYEANKLITSATPMGGSLRFTEAQHKKVAELACDIAKRNGWEGEWWKTPRLVGHEDITPVSRSTSTGGWDPGWLRATPYFDWDFVYSEIDKIVNPVTVVIDQTPESVSEPTQETDSVNPLLAFLAAIWAKLKAK